MIFLIQYDRRAGQIVGLRSFADSERSVASAERLDLELRLRSTGVENEVVILEAHDEGALRVTHARYFEDALTMLEAHREH
ncbi:MAG: hypothetical protein KA154_19330 [Gemmatimonadaceae bacterium]|jgi:hypothetical protein|nr:hypothetical protein [Gemmatimonadaceae bacterium]MCC6245069.1 hypothetical protein [Gemmatimonadaceae bacterium]